MTILPIVETKGGDMTAYIPTNIISITDGQIILSAKNFQKGQKPAINYGLSVSRLGGAVQTQEMKRLGARVRRELLSYLETKEVYELANEEEMSREMRERLRAGPPSVGKSEPVQVFSHERAGDFGAFSRDCRVGEGA